MFVVVSQEEMILLIREEVFDTMVPQYTFLNVKQGYFKKQSYLLWAADELVNQIRNRKADPPMKVLYIFANQMRWFSKLNPDNSYAFDVAHELAINIIDICRAAGWAKN